MSLLSFVLSCVDLTTLEGVDNDSKVEQLSMKAQSFCPQVASVCVYPIFVKTVKSILQNTSIGVTSVAGAFPSGQTPLAIKLSEVDFAIQQGADEIDMVISRGKFLDKQYAEVSKEIEAVKEVLPFFFLSRGPSPDPVDPVKSLICRPFIPLLLHIREACDVKGSVYHKNRLIIDLNVSFVLKKPEVI